MIAQADNVTRDWIRNPADEVAVRNGCWFDPTAGGWTVWWIERVCKLYEGESAGEPLRLMGCLECEPEPIPEAWGETWAASRAARYVDCLRAGHHCDWQYDVTMRVFGWQKHSVRWQRAVRRFRESSVFIPKKNKKSPTLAAWAMYLLCGDSEPGQKVFIGAKDGTQSREIAGAHAVAMMDQSAALTAECRLNKNKLRITHTESRSFLQPMSSSGVRTKTSKEGINGCVGIDETHVVDRDFIKIISRAGISRVQPLHFEFSTAGNNPDGYGKEQWDRGKSVEQAEVGFQDDTFFFAAWHAPEDITDAELDADPIKWGKLANPAWDHTIDPEEYASDYQKSKRTAADLLDFKMYRLNIWQNAANPWLKLDDWAKCEREFSEEDLYGQPCYAALDLSTVRDMTSLCLAFPQEDERVRFLWWFWWPEETAQKLSHILPVASWQSDPRTRLALTPGGTVDYGYIRSHFREVHDLFNVQELAYDDWNAEKVTQEISEGVRGMDGGITEAGTDVERINFGQGMKTMNEPTKAFEKRVIDGNIEHNGDPLIKWQIGNATIRPDANGNYKPLKPGKDSHKKIDGVVVGVMALARVMLAEEGDVWTYKPGSLLA